MPRKTLPKPDREMEKSLTNRLNWEPDEPHVQDVLFTEAEAAREELLPTLKAFHVTIQKIEQLLTTLIQQETLTTTDPLEDAESPVQQIIERRFGSRRHYAHLNALFAILRRRNLQGRLYVGQATAQLLQNLLEDQDTIWQDFLQATDVPAPQSSTPENSGGKEQAPNEQEKWEHENIRGARGPLKPLIGSVEPARHHLREFEQRLPELRAHLVQRTGRIEIFYVHKKTSFRSEVLALRKAIRRAEDAGISLDHIDPKIIAAVHPQVANYLLEMGLHAPIPKDLEREAYHFKKFGPYGKLRIKGIIQTKGTRKGANYAISFGPRNRPPGKVLRSYFS